MAAPTQVNAKQSKTRIWPAQMDGSTNHMSASTGANSAAVVTLAGTTGGIGQTTGTPPVTFSSVWWSYSGSPTGGNLTIKVGTATYLDIDITSAGPGFIPIDPPIALAAGTQAVLTLAAGGSGVTGKVGAGVWQEL